MALHRIRRAIALAWVLAMGIGCAAAAPLRIEGDVEPSLRAPRLPAPQPRATSLASNPATGPSAVRSDLHASAEPLEGASYADAADRVIRRARAASRPLTRLLESSTGRYVADWVYARYGDGDAPHTQRRFDVFPTLTETTLKVQLNWKW